MCEIKSQTRIQFLCFRFVIYWLYDFTEPSLAESQRKTSFNGELNGVLGAELIGASGHTAPVEQHAHNSDKLNGQDTQTMYVCTASQHCHPIVDNAKNKMNNILT